MKHHILQSLQHLEDQWGLDMPERLEDGIKFLIREFTFLDFFLSLQSFIDLSYMLDVVENVQLLFHHVTVELREISEIGQVVRLTDQLRVEIKMTKLEIRSEYLFPKVNKDGIVFVNPKFVINFIDTVVVNLGDLLKVYCSSSLLFVRGGKKEIGEVFKELKLLRNFVCFVSDRFVEMKREHIDLFIHVLEVVSHAAMIAWLYLPSNDDEGTNGLLSDHLEMKIKPIDPSIRKIYIDVLQALRSEWRPIIPIDHVADCVAGFVETLQHNLKTLSVSNSNTHQIIALQEMLNLLIANLSVRDLEFHLQDIDTVMVDCGILVYSLCEDVVLGDVTIDFPVTIHRIKRLIYYIIRKEFQSNLPRIHGLGYIDFVLSNLIEFQVRYPDSLDFVKAQLQLIQTKLEIAVQLYNIHNKLQEIGKAAYEVEYIVDSCVSKRVPDWCLKLWLWDINAEVAEIQQNIMSEIDSSSSSVLYIISSSVSRSPSSISISPRRKLLASPSTIAINTSPKSSELAKTSRINEDIIGFEDDIKTLIHQLTRRTRRLDIISIVGMPGGGKTTLAKKIYIHPLVVSRFDIQAECYVSPIYSLRGLLLSLLAKLHIDETSLHSIETVQLEFILGKTLRSKRYLILLDDIWDGKVWDDLKRYFPNSNNGSRILLTTRNHDVAYYVKSVSEPHHLRLLTYEESWELLKLKVCGNESCSPLVEKVGQEIARKCGGLPLSIVLVAGILSKKEKTEECWSQVAKDLSSYIASDAKAIIEPSYEHLPYYLKPCFLYFGIFLEDEEINVSKLTWLWIGEGFIKDLEGGSLQYIAKGYLENLIERNLVMNAKRSSGKVKTCRVHNLLLDFCKRKAEEEHFLLRIKWDQNDKSLSGVSSHKQLAQRRLAFYCEEENLVKWSSSCCPVDSVLFREYKRVDISSSRQASQFFYNFKFLKVLNLESIVICSFPTGLVYLRYFAAQTDQDSITSLIANLWNLETLILKPTKGRLKLPVTIWKMVRLRHLCIDNAYFTLDGAEGLLKKLEVLSNPCFSCAKDVELLSQKTPNLRELRCSFVDFRQEFFPKLDFLAWLETLEIHLAADSTVGGPYNFPPSLRNLTLSNFFLGSCHKSNISRLPHLRVLKLVSIFFDNDQWEVKGGEFLQLEVLKLVKCDFFEEWKASDEAFSMLNHLVLRECPYLKEIPSSFQDIFTLDLIKVKSCSESVEQSATVIKHMKAHCGNYLLKVFIQRENRNSLPENGELLLEQRGDEGDEKDQLLYSMDGLKEVVDEEEEKEEVKLIKGIINPAQGNQIDLDDDLFPEFEDFLSGEIECPLPSDKYDIGREEREKVYQIEMANNANELERLRNRVRILQERERNLEVELLEYYGLKEQESHIIELQKQLKIKSFEIHILSIKMNTLQAENQKLQEEVFHGTTARKDLEAARSKITELQKQMQLEANQTKAQLLLKQHVTGLQEKEEEAFKRDSKVDKKLKLVKELEVEVMELKRKNKELQHEKRALVIKLDAAESKIESLSNMTENEMVAQVREEVTNLKHTNEDLLKQVEGPQMNRFSEVEELVHLRWVNACLRHELRNYQTPQGKVSARDLSKNLSPRSEQKAKQLMLEYAGSERGQGDTDLESNFSQPSSPGSEDFDNASIDSSTSRFSTFSKKPNLIQKLKKWGSRGGKDNSSIMSSPARSLGGASPGRMSMSVRPRGLLELLMRNAGDGVAITRFGTAEEYDSPETPKLPPIRTQESSAEALNSVASSFSLMSKSVEGVLDEKYPAFKDRHKLAVEREKTIKVKAEQARAARFEKSLPPRLAQLKEKPVSLPGSVPVLPVVSASGDSAEPSGDGKTDSQAVSKMKLVNIEKRPTRTSRPPPKRSGGGPAPAGNNVTGGAPGGPPPPPPPPPGGGPPRPPPPPPPPPPGGGPPRPPPPPGSLMKGGAGGDKVHRAPELVEFYQSLMKRESKKDTSSALITATSNTSDARSNMIREIENRSTFLLAVKADVESRGEFVESLATEVHAASFTNIEDLVAFVNWLDEELSFLVDERAVLKHFDWPEGKADAFREAAFEYQDLMKLEKQVTTFVDDPNLQCDAALKKMYRLLKKVEQSVYALLGTRDMAASRYREFGIPTDWLQDSGVVGKIKLSSVQLARKYMKCVATELDAMDGPEKEPNREFFILQGFAGGFDAESMKAFEELRSRVQSQTGGENTQES